ncbi:MAG: VWA domain-containing protein [Planctomycetes bacterium]|nr:VWA domain-containing protein [Planctomycetota bacterium]
MHLVDARPLLLLLAIVPVTLAYARSLVDRRRVLLAGSYGLTVLAIGLLSLALCRPHLRRPSHRLHLSMLLDVSASVDDDALDDGLDQARTWIDQLRPGDTWDLYAVGASCRRATPDEIAEQAARWRQSPGDDPFRRHSRLADALLTARLDLPAGAAHRLVLLSDGRETDGGLDRAVRAARDDGADVRTVALSGMQDPETAVLSLRSGTPTAYFGQRVRLTARLYSNRPARGTLRIVNRGVVEAEQPVELKGGGNDELAVDVTMTTPGASVWAAELTSTDDRFPVNNRAECTIDVRGRAKVLVLHVDPTVMRPFKQALDAQGIDADVRGEHGMPAGLSEMLQFDAIVLAGLPATAMTTEQMLDLKRYVSDFGGGLAMLGSEHSFGLGGYYKTPVEQVLPIVSRYEKEKEQPSMAMVMVIDKSGSMDGAPIALARQAAKAAVELLSGQDLAGVVAFDGSPYVVSPLAAATDAGGVCRAIDQLIAGGGTNMYPAMEAGMAMLQQAHAKIRHMLILSDGQSLPGDFQGLASRMSDAGITLSTVALGDGADRALMESLARLGRGRYYETSSPDTVPRIFARETIEASRSAIREEPFLPVRVGQADMLEGIRFDEAPFLLGYVLSRPKPTARMLLVTEHGDPLLAFGRYGLGRTLAFTSDASDAWAAEWTRWPGFGRFWAQALRACIRTADTEGVSVERDLTAGTARYTLLARDDADRPLLHTDWHALWIDPDGRQQECPVRQVGLGRFELNCPRPDTGSTTVRLYDRANDKLKILHDRRDYPAEYLLAASPDDAFASLPAAGADILAGVPPVDAPRPLADTLLVGAMLCMIASILLRRL